ncbi:MAG TPA: ECF-type sigma factor [Pirellulales bacterium]|nr:ECF-type sigma factor [Pirellulales bacterium]
MTHDTNGPEDADAKELVSRAQAGDQDAAAELFHRFARRLIALAGSRIDRRLRGRVDPEDVVQSAYRSFFARLADGQFVLSEWEEVWALLVRITLRKCGHQFEFARAARRDAMREVTFAASGGDSSACWEPIARGPTPVEALVLAETVESLLEGFDEREREIVGQRLLGHGEREICASVGRSERTVRRVLKRLRRRAERLHGSSPG